MCGITGILCFDNKTLKKFNNDTSYSGKHAFSVTENRYTLVLKCNDFNTKNFINPQSVRNNA